MKPIYCVVCGKHEVLGKEGDPGEGICIDCERIVEEEIDEQETTRKLQNG